MDDEPLERWAARREKLLRPVGERRAVRLGPGPQAGRAHPHRGPGVGVHRPRTPRHPAHDRT
ncbi:DUF6087 family protein [Streptomyces violascens]|uniref:DUF6087 family protein n=1 Tax=Streptomyces violascens TaxID=67381 RepID=UPI0036C0F1B7